MKELSIEEKAQRYDEAVERARKIKNGEPINVPDGTLIPDAIFPELKESEGEKIRKELIYYFKENNAALAFNGISNECIIAWLEKQGEHANFRNKIQIGDKVTRNEDGVLVNLSQLNRVAKKQGECHISHDDEIMIKQLTEYFTTGHVLQNTNETVIEYLRDIKEKLSRIEQKPVDKVNENNY